ncbi:MAG: hypothetical protein HOG03_14885 [Desulfobacula sp.]|jgi:alkylhydroperoxidase/carboxymuconolactone decarboxylase family protein YurZ|nr:hypothetical protein [Desulfobacula sp.]MBT3486113.1 hypothetical protein [Desulfobacula sp.]MBT3805864.1 hypothetical protein [Desulfobacula sp.]MBT4026151.1 hypothetical protein [Desulfobacula sp.]MBT4200246.1 hypothetical protein [Desulfobacula sp.]
MYLPTKYKEFASEFPEVFNMALSTTGFPNMIAALNWANEVLEKDGK